MPPGKLVMKICLLPGPLRHLIFLLLLAEEQCIREAPATRKVLFLKPPQQRLFHLPNQKCGRRLSLFIGELDQNDSQQSGRGRAEKGKHVEEGPPLCDIAPLYGRMISSLVFSLLYLYSSTHALMDARTDARTDARPASSLPVCPSALPVCVPPRPPPGSRPPPAGRS